MIKDTNGYLVTKLASPTYGMDGWMTKDTDGYLVTKLASPTYGMDG